MNTAATDPTAGLHVPCPYCQDHHPERYLCDAVKAYVDDTRARAAANEIPTMAFDEPIQGMVRGEDPPYLGDTREPGLNYRHEMKDAVAHRELAEVLHEARAAVVISGYASDLYDRELYPGWDRRTIATFSGNATTDRRRTEVLWSNRPPIGTTSRPIHRHSTEPAPMTRGVQVLHPLVVALRARRLALGLDRHDIARATGYHPDSVSTWENGRSSPSLRALVAYAAAVEARLELVVLTPEPLTITDSVVGLVPDYQGSTRRLTKTGHSANQIAIQLGCSQRTVQRQRARARQETA